MRGNRPLHGSRLARAALLTACVCLGAPAPAVGAQSASAGLRPSDSTRLVLVLTVDQLLPEYLDRWRHQLTGGLGRLMDSGVVFTQAFHDHAITETAPGHASVLSGRFPYSTGIAANTAGVNTSDAPLVGTPGVGASPARFRGTTLADWMHSTEPRTRVLSVSRKDRGAILPVGRGAHAVFWYAPASGDFTTSTWYGDTLPTWVQQFNARSMVLSQYAGRVWDLLLPDSAYAEPDSVPAESFGQDFLFPYTLPDDTLRATNLILGFPFMDALTLDFAWEGVQAMQLGQGAHTDLLAVSLSTTDAIGHRWGPASREMHDHILRLDRRLGEFFDSLLTVVGQDQLVVVLTSDHGVAPVPEADARPGLTAADRRVLLDAFDRAISEAARVAQRARLPLDAFEFDGHVLSVDRGQITDSPRELRAVARAFAREASRLRGVARVDLLDDLATADTVRDDVARRWLHMFRPGGNELAVVTLKPYHQFGQANVATHGSPYDYDAHVPIIVWAPGVPARRDDTPVRVVDIGPTLAAWLSVTPLEALDGRLLPGIVTP